MSSVKIAGIEYQPGTVPTPELVLAARKAAGHTQAEAAKEIHYTLRAWQRFEAPAGASSHREMQPAIFELYCRKLGLWPNEGRK